MLLAGLNEKEWIMVMGVAIKVRGVAYFEDSGYFRVFRDDG